MGHYFILLFYWVVVPVLSLVVALVVGFVLCQLADKYPKRLGWLTGLAVVMFFAFLLSGLGFGYATAINGYGEPIAIVAPDNTIVALAGKNRDIVWRWDKRLRGNRVIDLSPVAYDPISMELQPITTNPKVRALRYWVRIGAPGTLEARLKYLNKFEYLGDYELESAPIKEFVKFQLYEFDELHSKELATLYNPLDDAQQARLFKLVRSSIGSTLEEVGLRVDGAEFDFISVSDLITKSRR